MGTTYWQSKGILWMHTYYIRGRVDSTPHIRNQSVWLELCKFYRMHFLTNIYVYTCTVDMQSIFHLRMEYETDCKRKTNNRNHRNKQLKNLSELVLKEPTITWVHCALWNPGNYEFITLSIFSQYVLALEQISSSYVCYIFVGSIV